MKHLSRLIILIFLVSACSNGGTDDPSNDDNPFGQEVDEWGRPILGETGFQDPLSKDDGIQGKPGLPVSVDDSATAVWDVKNAWADTDTPEAKEAGIAWGEDSGLNWEQKFTAWVGSLEKTEAADGFGETFILTTPYGKSLPAPTLECAEVAMFLRVAFASWYNLPFFMEAIDGNRDRAFFGHFGVRTLDGPYPKMPNYKTRYPDFSDQADAVREGGEWPSDPSLRRRKLAGGFDDIQEALGEDEELHAGAYFDEIFLNKRVGHYMMINLAFLGSVNVADSVNTYNVRPWSIRPGDTLLERWQARGIGHTLVLIRSTEVGETEIDGQTVPLLEAELVSGSMPRRQPSWENPAASKRSFTLDETGGGEFVEFGGGIKRWRAATNVNGKWTNLVVDADVDDWINSRDDEAIGARPAQFEEILASLSPEEKIVALADIIETKRQHLQKFPASCSARINREKVFDELYAVMETEFERSKDDVDAEYRKFEDYVFAELVYNKSRSCCWNSSTSAMYEMAVQFNQENVYDAETGTCNDIVVFMNRDDGADGFEVFRAYAESIGRGEEWLEWSADETCPQSDVLEATEEEHRWTPLCDIADAINPNAEPM